MWKATDDARIQNQADADVTLVDSILGERLGVFHKRGAGKIEFWLSDIFYRAD